MADIRHTTHNKDTNPDPITGEPGSHPVGTGAGAAGGGLTGVAIGTAIGGPIGGAVGAVIGALAGAFAGKGIAEAIDPTAEDAYWREHHTKQPFDRGHGYDKYAPAYRAGYQGYQKHEPGTKFEDAEPTLRSEYETMTRTHQDHTGTTVGTGASDLGPAAGVGGSGAGITSTGETVPGAHAPLAWDEAKPAAKAAWDRVERGEAVRVPLSEEQVSVGKREVENGSLQVHKVVKTETVNQPVELKHEQIDIERVETNRTGNVPANAFKEEQINMPLKREEAVVKKTAHVTDEVKVHKISETDRQQVHETVRKEEVKVENKGEPRVRREP